MSKANYYMVIPPSNFCYVEENICRCTQPVSRNNIAFIESISIGYLLNVSGRKLDAALLAFCEERDIVVKSLLQEGEAPPFGSVAQLEAWIASCLEILLTQSNEKLTLLVGSADTFFDCLLIGCLRRLQEWSFVSIIAEFRQSTWPHRHFDLEQVVEQFPRDLADLSACTPEFLLLHENFKEEEGKLLARCDAEKDRREALGRTRAAQAQAQARAGCDPSASPQADGGGDSGGAEGAEGAICASFPEPTDPAEAVALAGMEAEEEAEETEQGRIDEILRKLFFSPKHQVRSADVVFDPLLSLISEKDEED